MTIESVIQDAINKVVEEKKMIPDECPRKENPTDKGDPESILTASILPGIDEKSYFMRTHIKCEQQELNSPVCQACPFATGIEIGIEQNFN